MSISIVASTMDIETQFKRKEYKYCVPIEMLDPIRQRFLAHMAHDPNCRDRERNRYSVRSIYFDTPHLLFYFEKIDGLKIRKKLRVRAYNNCTPDCPAFLEIKRKYKDNIYKERARVAFDEVENLTNGARLHLLSGESSFVERAALNKFIFLTKKLSLVPTALITYEREALFGIDDSSLRVTFDYHVRSLSNPIIDDLFREEDLRNVTDPFFIVEIKFWGRMPIWIRSILRDFNLRRESVSKYCRGLDRWNNVDKRQDVCE